MTWLNNRTSHSVKQSLGVGDGQGNLACGSPWGHKESDMTSNWADWLNHSKCIYFHRFPPKTYSYYVIMGTTFFGSLKHFFKNLRMSSFIEN